MALGLALLFLPGVALAHVAASKHAGVNMVVLVRDEEEQCTAIASLEQSLSFFTAQYGPAHPLVVATTKNNPLKWNVTQVVAFW